MIHRLWAALVVVGLARPAAAHTFETGQDLYDLFLQGVAQPWLMLPVAVLLIGTGMFIGIWRVEGVIAAWPGLLLGALVGFGLGPVLPQVSALVLFGAALGVACLGLVGPPLSTPIITALSALCVGLSGRFLMETHVLGELPVIFLIGMGVGATTAVALPAGLIQFTRERIDHGALLIGWRALISWVGAIAILSIAFALRPV